MYCDYYRAVLVASRANCAQYQAYVVQWLLIVASIWVDHVPQPMLATITAL